MQALIIALSALILCGWIYLALFRSLFWLPLLPALSPAKKDWPRVDIIVPARNEAEVLARTIPSLLGQDYPGGHHVFLVDDHSDDGTAALAQKIASDLQQSEHFTIVMAQDLREGWSGKVAAMQAGVEKSAADFILFTDADIDHPPASLKNLMMRVTEADLDLCSLMVRLHCTSRAERLLIPAFVFFFAMLYPFRAVNDPRKSIAAAAGGVMLLRRRALDNIGGLQIIKSALIDDCSLAKAVKFKGGDHGLRGRIELCLSSDVDSLRGYHDIAEIWRMIARTAFTQLRYSGLLLAGTVAGMGLLFLAPLLFPFSASHFVDIAGLLALALMAALYLPSILFYRLPWYWALTLPFAAVLYIGATADSARLYWSGKGGYWKGRRQA